VACFFYYSLLPFSCYCYNGANAVFSQKNRGTGKTHSKRREIEQELFRSLCVDADDVYVLVENGHAVLTGIVDSWSEYNAAAENAYEGGAAWVENKLRVNPR